MMPVFISGWRSSSWGMILTNCCCWFWCLLFGGMKAGTRRLPVAPDILDYRCGGESK